MTRLLNKIFISYSWTSAGGKSHNNMPKILFVNSISFCLTEQSLEKIQLPKEPLWLYITPAWIINMAFCLQKQTPNVLVRVYPTGIEFSVLSGSEILAICFWIRDDSDRCSAEMQVNSFMKAVKIVPKTPLFWIQCFDSLWTSTVTSKIWFH